TDIHNRLTHSLNVSAVARPIAIALHNAAEDTRELVSDLGGRDPAVAQAAAAARALAHPPLRHLGLKEVDRTSVSLLHLADGFEGNAQTFRILTALDSCDATPRGLNLTRAVRAGVLKYPWERGEWAGDQGLTASQMPRGVGNDA